MNNTTTPTNEDKPIGSYEQNTRIVCQNTMAKPKNKRSITIERVMEQCENDEYEGICLACGEDAQGVEPDAREYECESCGKEKVYGCQELLFMIG
jgi:predicted RNA-binding Zn-ribbon protein involved in translation (DUF1610 family)